MHTRQFDLLHRREDEAVGTTFFVGSDIATIPPAAAKRLEQRGRVGVAGRLCLDYRKPGLRVASLRVEECHIRDGTEAVLAARQIERCGRRLQRRALRFQRLGVQLQRAQRVRHILESGGDLTFALFAAGIIGTGLLAVPVLAGSAAYAVADAFGLRGSLELPAGRALGFYAIVGAATLAGAGLSLSNIDPVAMLFWTAVINGIVAVPIMAAMMVLLSSTRTKLTLCRHG